MAYNESFKAKRLCFFRAFGYKLLLSGPRIVHFGRQLATAATSLSYRCAQHPAFSTYLSPYAITRTTVLLATRFSSTSLAAVLGALLATRSFTHSVTHSLTHFEVAFSRGATLVPSSLLWSVLSIPLDSALSLGASSLSLCMYVICMSYACMYV